MSDASAAPPVCPRHPGTVAYVRCQRCERPTCPQCQVPAPVGVLCVDCVREAEKNARPVRSRLGFVAARGTPWATYGLILANVGVYLLAPLLLGRNWRLDLGLWPEWGAAVEVMYPASGDDWYRWITAGFVHFSLIHLGLNMLVLWQFGTQLEPALGRVRFLALYGLALLGSSAVIVFFGSAGSVHGGASGAIFGLIAAYAIVLRALRLPWVNMAVFAGVWLVAGFFFTGLSWEGHLGGAIAGGLTMALMLRGVSRREREQRAGAN
jgi:membrane associated rhomboid family serine protease